MSYLPWVLLLGLALIWGSSFILIKKGLVGLTSGEVGALRVAAASVFILPLALRNIYKIPKEKIAYVVASGFLGSLFPSFLFSWAQTHMSSSLSSIINTLTPLLTVLVGWMFFKTKFSVTVLVGVVVGFLGAFILIIFSESSGIQVNYYALLVVLATLMYALNVNLVKSKLSGISSIAVTSVSIASLGPVAWLYLGLETKFFVEEFHSQKLEATFYVLLLGFLGTAFALVLFNKLIQLTNAVFTSSVTYLIPLVAISWGIWDGESVYPSQGIGFILILFGILITHKSSKLQKK